MSRNLIVLERTRPSVSKGGDPLELYLMNCIRNSVAFNEKVLDIIEKNHRLRMTDMMNILESARQFSPSTYGARERESNAGVGP